MNSFAERLREALNLRGLTQAELARRTGIGRNSISDYLKEKYEAKQDNVLLLANALEVSEAWLMGLDVEMEKDNFISIYNKLDKNRQQKVVLYAKKQLNEQNNNIVNLKNKTITSTLAAHKVDENHVSSQEEIDDLNAYLDEADKKYDKHHKD